ncbi:MAG TPA: DUF6632 domain-containing protein [Terriglobales bacterium]|nr:DUF6632 domain-containing protein [Terriglobales bacterium]
MNRERILKVTLVVVGLLFVVFVYPIAMTLWHHDHSGYSDVMMLSIYVTLGVFLLNAARSPSAHRSLIAFAAWSSIAHAFVMTIMAFQSPSDREMRFAVAAFGVIGIVLLALLPRKAAVVRASVAA